MRIILSLYKLVILLSLLSALGFGQSEPFGTYQKNDVD
jgi:hypothetical protein